MTRTEEDKGAPSGPGSHASTEPASGLGPSGFDPSRMAANLSLGDKYRITRAGADFGAPEFSRQACEWMAVQGFAAQKQDGRWALTPLGNVLRDQLRRGPF